MSICGSNNSLILSTLEWGNLSRRRMLCTFIVPIDRCKANNNDIDCLQCRGFFDNRTSLRARTLPQLLQYRTTVQSSSSSTSKKNLSHIDPYLQVHNSSHLSRITCSMSFNTFFTIQVVATADLCRNGLHIYSKSLRTQFNLCYSS